MLAARAALPGVHLATHVSGVEVRRLLASETHKANRACRLQRSHQPRDLDQHGDGGGIVIGAGCVETVS